MEQASYFVEYSKVTCLELNIFKGLSTNVLKNNYNWNAMSVEEQKCEK